MRQLRSNSVIGAQEEGEYQYAADSSGGTTGREERHVEPAILYQPLDETSDVLGLDEEWRISIE
jgi:hypothetical protein